SASRVQDLGHQQLLPGFFLPIAALAICEILKPGQRKSRRRMWIAAAFASGALQLLSTFYLGWFLAIGVGVAGIWAFTDPRLRKPILNVVRQDWAWIAVAGLASIAL